MSSRSLAVAGAGALCGLAAVVIEAPHCSHHRPELGVALRAADPGTPPLRLFSCGHDCGRPIPNADPRFLVSLRYDMCATDSAVDPGLDMVNGALCNDCDFAAEDVEILAESQCNSNKNSVQVGQCTAYSCYLWHRAARVCRRFGVVS
eukprot:359707-Chlamydomonas_euryale.AAC.8